MSRIPGKLSEKKIFAFDLVRGRGDARDPQRSCHFSFLNKKSSFFLAITIIVPRISTSTNNQARQEIIQLELNIRQSSIVAKGMMHPIANPIIPRISVRSPSRHTVSPRNSIRKQTKAGLQKHFIKLMKFFILDI